MYTTVGNVLHVWDKIVLLTTADMTQCSIHVELPHFYKHVRSLSSVPNLKVTAVPSRGEYWIIRNATKNESDSKTKQDIPQYQ